MTPPLIAITTDLYTREHGDYARVAMAYAQRVERAGGIPVLLAPVQGEIDTLITRFDGFVLTGGDDPRTEPFGVESHPEITPVFEARQRYETRLLDTLNTHHSETPVLGICLGMQMMALYAGGSLHQHLPESHPESHANHWSSEHEIVPESSRLSAGVCHSHHKQAVDSPGTLSVLARAPDGIIESIGDEDRPFYLGVQWHPERTESHDLGQRLFNDFVEAARVTTRAPITR